MKPVNRRKSEERRAKPGGSRRKSENQKSAKKSVLSYRRPMSATNEQPIPEIPGVDQLEAPEPGSKILAGAFYSDQIEMLVNMAKAARDRAGQNRIFIAPEGNGFSIFKRRAAK